MLAGEVRQFVETLPPAMSDRQALAVRYVEFQAQRRAAERKGMQVQKPQPERGRDEELTR